MSIKNRPLSANFHSSNYYPHPEPKNIYRLNPLVLGSLKNLDVDDVQEIFSKGIYDDKNSIQNQKKFKQKIFENNDDIKEIKSAIENAKLNEFRAHQIHQNQLLRLQNLIKDTQNDETVLDNLKKEIENQKKIDEIKQKERFKAKYLLQEQMKEHEKNKLESIKEYERDKKQVDDLIEKLKQEDIQNFNENERKKAINRMYMENAYKEKAERKQKEKEDEEKQKAAERKYFEDKEKQENEFNKKKEEIQNLKDLRFNELCNQAAQEAANKEYWENVRNELYLEQGNKKRKMAEQAEKDKKERQKEEMKASALLHQKIKEENKIKEKENEKIFRIKYMEKIKEEEEIDRLNAQKRKQKELELKMEVEKQWQQKLAQYQLQKEAELKNREKLQIQQQAKKYIIEQEKQRLIKENEALLKGYYPLGYQRAMNSLKKNINNNQNIPNIDTKHEIIMNNIFGNNNPNKTSDYPKFGNIKNYVYDKGIQEVNHKINVTNYPMYNATANNTYDSYPTPEEYLKLMKQTGQKNYSYAGNTDTTGIPMRSQMPVYVNKALSRSISNGFIQNNNFSNIGNRRNLTKSNSTILTGKEMPQLSKYRIQKVDDVGIDKNNNNNYANKVEEKVAEPQ